MEEVNSPQPVNKHLIHRMYKIGPKIIVECHTGMFYVESFTQEFVKDLETTDFDDPYFNYYFSQTGSGDAEHTTIYKEPLYKESF